MIRTPDRCLDRETLHHVASGRLPQAAFEQAILHLDQCPHCADQFSHIELASLAVDLRNITQVPHAGYTHEPECEVALGNLLLNRIDANETSAILLPIKQIGPYQLLRPLASGGMGAVYLGQHERLRRFAAIKLLSRDKSHRVDWLSRFDREMKAVASLEHPHIVRALDAGEQSGWHYLVMEFLDGFDVSRVANRVHDLSIADVCSIARSTALALEAIHGIGMVHRDVKPSNLFLTNDGNIKLLDLGLVLSGESPLSADERLTTVGHLMGTLPYMAPEQLADSRNVDARADLYSLGATMYRLLAGKPPYGNGSNIAATIQAINQSEPVSIKQLRSDLPPLLGELITKLLAHDPVQRPASAIAVADQLHQWTAGSNLKSLSRRVHACVEPVQANPSIGDPAPIGLAQASPKRSRWAVITALALLPIAFALGILLTIQTDRGTLIIESDVPGVSVAITQGNEPVQSLQVEQTANKVTLRSGEYAIQLEGVQADKLVLSQSEVLISRGKERVVKIISKPLMNINDPANVAMNRSQPMYQGKPYDYWINALEYELNPESLTIAMNAIIDMTDDANRQKHVQAIIKVIRDRDQTIVSELQTRYRRKYDFNKQGVTLNLNEKLLLSQEGLTLVAKEFSEGTEQSRQFWLSIFSDILPSKIDKNREQWRALVKTLDIAFPWDTSKFETKEHESHMSDPSIRSLFSAQQLRLSVTLLLGDEVYRDSALMSYLRKSEWTGIAISDVEAIVQNVPNAEWPTAAMAISLVHNTEADEQQVVALLDRLIQHDTGVALTILSRVSVNQSLNQTALQKIIESIQSTDKPFLAVTAFWTSDLFLHDPNRVRSVWSFSGSNTASSKEWEPNVTLAGQIFNKLVSRLLDPDSVDFIGKTDLSAFETIQRDVKTLTKLNPKNERITWEMPTSTEAFQQLLINELLHPSLFNRERVEQYHQLIEPAIEKLLPKLKQLDPNDTVRSALVLNMQAFMPANPFNDFRGSLDLADEMTSKPVKNKAAVYQGKPRSFWLETLQKEKEPKSLVTAVEAILSLSVDETREEDLKAVLQIARQLGGFTISNSESNQFMECLIKYRQMFLTTHGVDLLIGELQDGTINSKKASVALLTWTGDIGFIKTQCTEEQLQRISDALATAFPFSPDAESEHSRMPNFIQLLRLEIARLTKTSICDDQQTIAWLRYIASRNQSLDRYQLLELQTVQDILECLPHEEWPKGVMIMSLLSELKPPETLDVPSAIDRILAADTELALKVFVHKRSSSLSIRPEGMRKVIEAIKQTKEPFLAQGVLLRNFVAGAYLRDSGASDTELLLANAVEETILHLYKRLLDPDSADFVSNMDLQLSNLQSKRGTSGTVAERLDEIRLAGSKSGVKLLFPGLTGLVNRDEAISGGINSMIESVCEPLLPRLKKLSPDDPVRSSILLWARKRPASDITKRFIEELGE